jgi:hypothetical protein
MKADVYRMVNAPDRAKEELRGAIDAIGMVPLYGEQLAIIEDRNGPYGTALDARGFLIELLDTGAFENLSAGESNTLRHLAGVYSLSGGERVSRSLVDEVLEVLDAE